jgi:hypothetical protein
MSHKAGGRAALAWRKGNSERQRERVRNRERQRDRESERIVTAHNHLGRVTEKKNKVVIRDLELGCSEISRQTASSKDVKRIAGLVSGRGLGKCEVKGDKEVIELERKELKADVGRLKS